MFRFFGRFGNKVPEMLKKNFKNIYILMGKIIEEKDFDEKIRENGFDIITSIIEKYPKILDDKKLSILVIRTNNSGYILILPHLFLMNLSRNIN